MINRLYLLCLKAGSAWQTTARSATPGPRCRPTAKQARKAFRSARLGSVRFGVASARSILHQTRECGRPCTSPRALFAEPSEASAP
eukprot:4533170-Alexandrium_andersonii.AAC.1